MTENYPGHENYGALPPFGGSAGNSESKKKKDSKDKQDKASQSGKERTAGEAADISLDFRNPSKETGGPAEGSVWERILPKKPFEVKKESTPAAEAKKLTEDTIEVEKPAESITAEQVIEIVAAPGYEESTPGNLKEAALQDVEKRIPELEAEAIAEDDPDAKRAVEDVEAFLKGVREGLIQLPGAAAEQAEAPSVGTIFGAEFARFSELLGLGESAHGVPVTEALDDQLLPGEAVAGSVNEQSGLTYEDMDSTRYDWDAAQAAGRSSAAGGQPPRIGYGQFGAAGGMVPGMRGEFGRGVAATMSPVEGIDPTTNERSAILRGLLLGGVAGWFLAKHGAKKELKKAEAEKLSLRERLEVKEVEKLAVQADLANKASQIRQMSREHTAALTAAENRTQAAAKTAEAAYPSAPEPGPSQEGDSSRGRELPPKPLFERIAEAAPLAAAAGLLLEASPTERADSRSAPITTGERPLGPPLERAPSVPSGLQERPFERPNTIRSTSEAPPPYLKPVEAMSQHELLEVADKIVVDGESVSQAYESRDISGPSLRRIVAEYQRGGDVRKVLVEEKVRSSYERDPKLRMGTLSASPATGGVSQAVAILAQQTQPALPPGIDSDEPLLPPSPRRSLLPAHGQPSVPVALVVANVAAFVILAVLFIVWLFVRS
jgi:hypothetical protein